MNRSTRRIPIPERRGGWCVPTAAYLLAILRDWSVIGASFWLASSGIPLLVVLGLVVLGHRQHALGILGHDASHGGFHRARRVNDAIANLTIYFPLGISVEGYRRFHREHHRKAGGPEDPEKRAYKHGWWYRRPFSRGRVALIGAMDLVGCGSLHLLRIVRALRARTLSEAAPILGYWGGLVAICAATDSLWILAMWVGAEATTMMFFFRWRDWSEHEGVHGTHRFEPGVLSRALFFPYNTWCHWEHHAWPSISCFLLPEARRAFTDVRVLSEAELFGRLADETDVAPTSQEALS